jgi:hypothetical protein
VGGGCAPQSKFFFSFFFLVFGGEFSYSGEFFFFSKQSKKLFLGEGFFKSPFIREN